MSASASKPDFQRFQYAFTRHIRNPKRHPRPKGVAARRMKIYNELLYNNLEGFLLACFPVLRKILGTRKWGKLIRDFFTEHECHTPFFRQIPDEFVQYLQTERGVRENDPPFLLELAHYEWIELVLSVSNKETDPGVIDPEGDLLLGEPVLNPVLALLQYQYPVHRLSPKYQPQIPPEQPTYLLVFRNADYEVRFVELNPIAAHLLEILKNKRTSGEKALLFIAKSLKHPNPAAVMGGGLAILRDLHEQGAVLGTQVR